jgi:hypothetical protein
MFMTNSDPCPRNRKRLEPLAAVNQVFGSIAWPRFPLLFILLCALTLNCAGSTVYLSDAGSGDGSGSGPADCKSTSIWNSSQGYLAPGDFLTMVGTNALIIGVWSSGTAASPITVNFYPGAKFSAPNGEFIRIVDESYVVVDGGPGGSIMENTGSGTGLAYGYGQNLIDISGSSYITVKNIQFLNQYVHTSPSDLGQAGGGGVIYANWLGGTNYFQNLTFSNACWCLTILATSCPSITVSNCSFYRFDHGVVPNNGVNISILNCRFDTTANWDTTANGYHHDGIHYFGGTSTPQSFIIAGNIFKGDWGANNTAFIFNETAPENVKLYNNVLIQYPGNTLNDGMVVSGGTNQLILNNTFVGSGTYNATAITATAYNTVIANNLFNNFNVYVGIVAGSVIALSNNVYANQAPGGDGWSSFASWTNNVGEVNSSYTAASSGVVNGDGTIPNGSPAINGGANLSSVFTTDYAGNARPATGAWMIGAYQVVSMTPFVSLAASSTSITNDQYTTLTWSSVNATNVTLNGGSVSLSGSNSVSPNKTTIYTVMASGSNGTFSANVTVTNVPSPPSLLRIQ